MDYCDSGDLQQLIGRQKKEGTFFEESQVTMWLVQLLSAVDYLHHWKVLHRDIKVRTPGRRPLYTSYHAALPDPRSRRMSLFTGLTNSNWATWDSQSSTWT